MDYVIPTTQEQMYDSLKEIYHYYRVNNFDFMTVDIPLITLPRLVVSYKTEAKLRDEALIILAPSHKKRRLDYQTSLNDKILEATDAVNSLTLEKADKIAEITLAMDALIERAKSDARKKGLFDSSALSNEISALEVVKRDRINECANIYDDKITALRAKISNLNASIEGIDDKFSDLEQAEISAKILELKESDETLNTEKSKYNTSLWEKEQRQVAQIAQLNETLRIRYMELSTVNNSKEQLVAMGYYKDVIDCVCAFYDTLDPVSAYNVMLDDADLVVYLDDFYGTIIGLYNHKAQNYVKNNDGL